MFKKILEVWITILLSKQLTLFLKVRFHFKLFLLQSILNILNNLGQNHSVKFSLQLDSHPLKKTNAETAIEDISATNVQKLSLEHYGLLKRDHKYLIHAWNCKDFNCTSEGCLKMKQFILHSYECKTRGCRLCKSTLILCYYHVWVCKNDHTCDLPFCSILWQKMGLQIKFQEVTKDIEGCTGDHLKEKLQSQLTSIYNSVGRKRKFLKRQM